MHVRCKLEVGEVISPSAKDIGLWCRLPQNVHPGPAQTAGEVAVLLDDSSFLLVCPQRAAA